MKAEKVRSCLRDYSYTSSEEWAELDELEKLAELGEMFEELSECRNFVMKPRGGTRLRESWIRYYKSQQSEGVKVWEGK